MRFVENHGEARNLGEFFAEVIDFSERGSFLGVVIRAVGVGVSSVAVFKFFDDNLFRVRDEHKTEVTGLREAIVCQSVLEKRFERS